MRDFVCASSPSPSLTFSQKVVMNSVFSLICYSLSGLRDQMKPMGTIITLDHLLGRVMRNYKAGKITFVYADEFALFPSLGLVESSRYSLVSVGTVLIKGIMAPPIFMRPCPGWALVK